MLSDSWKLEQTGAGERAARGHGRQEPPRAPACALRGQFSDVSLSVPDCDRSDLAGRRGVRRRYLLRVVNAGREVSPPSSTSHVNRGPPRAGEVRGSGLASLFFRVSAQSPVLPAPICSQTVNSRDRAL